LVIMRTYIIKKNGIEMESFDDKKKALQRLWGLKNAFPMGNPKTCEPWDFTLWSRMETRIWQ